MACQLPNSSTEVAGVVVEMTCSLFKRGGFVISVSILSLARIMTSDFGLFYQLPMNSSYLKDVTQTLDVYVFNNLVGNDPNIGLNAAVSAFQSVVGFILVILANFVIKKVDDESALF